MAESLDLSKILKSGRFNWNWFYIFSKVAVY